MRDEKELRELIARAETEAVAEIKRFKKEMAALAKTLISGAQSLAGASSEIKQEYHQKANKQIRDLSDQSMNRFFELTPYSSQLTADEAPQKLDHDLYYDLRMLGDNSSALRWHRGKIKQYNNTGSLASDTVRKAIFRPAPE